MNHLHHTNLLIGHNIKFDTLWLHEIGIEFDCLLWDTMICEYVFARSQRVPLDLSSCCKRYQLPTKDDVEIKKYLAEGVGFEAMPQDIVEKYGRHDVLITFLLFLAQLKRLGAKI